MKKIISPLMHSVNDYALATAQMVVPEVLDLDQDAKNLYKVLALNLSGYTAVTEQPASLKPILSWKAHKCIDIANLGIFGLLFLTKTINKDKKALIFHSACTAISLMNVLLTDWEANDDWDTEEEAETLETGGME